MTTLLVAAGGGGDAVGALLLSRLLVPAGEPLHIATCAWERLRIDPTPGPRACSGFSGLAVAGGRPCEVTVATDTIPPGRSTLPRLRGDTSARLFVLDLDHGARGLTQQLAALAQDVGADRLAVMDIGGDIVASGAEPGLRSPLADGLALAGAVGTGLPTSLTIAGPGLDAELSEADTLARLDKLHASPLGAVTSADVKTFAHVLDWHPTEASALLAAAARGMHGPVDMRRGDRPILLSEHSSDAWLVDVRDLDGLPVAEALAGTATLSEAEEVAARYAPSELDYERTKATTERPLDPPADWSQAADAYARHALNHGARYATTRRLLEAIHATHDQESEAVAALGNLRTSSWPLWLLEALTT